MAQYFRDSFVFNDINDIYQVCQISYHDERVVEILFHPATQRPVIQDKGEWFELRSPDIQHLSILNVLEALGYARENFVVLWPEETRLSLNTLVRDACLFQAAIYPAADADENPAPIIENNPPPQVDFVNPFGNPEAEMRGVLE